MTRKSTQKISNDLTSRVPNTLNSFQEVTRDNLSKIPGAQLQEMLGDLAGVAPVTSKSVQEYIFDNVQSTLSLTDPYTQWSTQELLEMAEAGGMTFDEIIGNAVAASNTHSVDFELSSSQHAECADDAALSITGDLSIEFWFKAEQLPSSVPGAYTMVSKYDSGDSKRSFYLAFLTNDKMQFLFSASGGTGDHSSATTDSAIIVADDVGSWVHFAVTVDVSAGNAGILFYKNGVLVDDTDGSGTSTAIHDNASKFAIGCQFVAGSSATLSDGKVDDVRLWNDIRTITEIEDNKDSELDGDEANLAGYWKLNNDYTDETTNENDLTGVNTPTFSEDPAF